MAKHWITTKDFENKDPVNQYHKELAHIVKPECAIQNMHILFRRTLYLSSVEKNMVLNITADDYYKLYINGEYVGQGPADAYHMHYHFNSYPVSSFLKAGENTICVHTYYHGLVTRQCVSGDFRQGMWLELFSGGECILVSDEHWRYTVDTSRSFGGEILGYNTQFAENIDMTHSIGSWMQPKYDDSWWENAIICEDDHVLTKQDTPPVDRYEIYPKDIIQFDMGHYLLDFGKEVVGCVRLHTQGQYGSRVVISCGEELLPDGHVRYEMRCNVCYRETWILSGGEDCIENYAYKGFRYVEIWTNDPAVKENHFSVMAQHYPITKPASFSTNDDKIEKIWDICKNAVIISSQEAFLDCPTREKGQYLGDLTVTSVAHSYLTGDTRLYKKALLDFANTSFICKGLMAVAPGGFMQEIADFSLLYPLQVLQYYHLTGDKELLMQLLPVADGIIEYFEQYERSDGLLEHVHEKWNLVDWPENSRDNYDFPLTLPVGPGCHAVINAYYYGAKKTINQIRCYLGMEEKYDVEAMLRCFRRAFYSEKKQLFVDREMSVHASIHVNALALFWEIAEEKSIDGICNYLMERRLNCGTFFAYFVLKGLVKFGRYRDAMALIRNDSPQSWMNMISEGATSCFEAWGKEQKWNTSLCHPWACAPILLIIEDFLGIKFVAGKQQPQQGYSVENITLSFGGWVNDIPINMS